MYLRSQERRFCIKASQWVRVWMKLCGRCWHLARGGKKGMLLQGCCIWRLLSCLFPKELGSSQPLKFKFNNNNLNFQPLRHRASTALCSQLTGSGKEILHVPISHWRTSRQTRIKHCMLPKALMFLSWFPVFPLNLPYSCAFAPSPAELPLC